MTRAVLDTNVLVSGVLSPGGAPGRVVDACIDGAFQPVVSDAILTEYEEVLFRPKLKLPRKTVLALLGFIRETAFFASFAHPVLPELLPDADDAIFLDAAAGADAPVVTGNLRHFPAQLIHPIRALSPAEFLNALTTGSSALP
jgi:putative PIN family toxin of toxin-antitoxin system